jgi:hypothetical protein
MLPAAQYRCVLCYEPTQDAGLPDRHARPHAVCRVVNGAG